MATIGNQSLTLADTLAGRTRYGLIDREVVELLVKQNPMLDDIPIVKANDGNRNRTTVRTGMPSAAWVGYAEGPLPSKGAKAQVSDVAGHLESLLEIPKRLYEDTEDKDAFLADEVSTHTETMMNVMQEALIYGKIKNEPRKFNGLVNWYGQAGNSNAGVPSANFDSKDAAYYVFDGSKAGTARTDFRSIFLVGWGTRSIHGFFPQNHKNVGLTRGPLDKDWSFDANGGRYEVLRQLFSWDFGLSVPDFRYGGRIANIERDNMMAAGQPDYILLLQRLVSRVKSGSVRQVLYMEKIVWENIQTLFYAKTMGNAIKYGDLEQRKPTTILGVPVRICDAMEIDEEKVN